MAAPELVQRAKERVGLVLRDKWRLDSLLGVGGSAAVYAATHRNGKHGAIKLLHPEFASQPDFVERFLQEGYVANKIEHPGAVSILDDDRTDDGLAFLVMELLEGYTLERRLRKQTSVPIGDALRIVEELLDAVGAAHEKGIIHRDIKPANIFVTKQNQVKVLDFGIARLGEARHLSSSTQLGMPLGTPAFMPPEQARGRWGEVDARTDLWAVGALLWALITGQRPRQAETPHKELLLAMTEALPPLVTVVPHATTELSQLVDRALQFDMSARWPNARTMQQALRLALLLEQASSSPKKTPPPPAPAVEVPARMGMGPRTSIGGGRLPSATISGLTSASSLLRAAETLDPQATGEDGSPSVPPRAEPSSLEFSGPLSNSRYDALGERPTRTRPPPSPSSPPRPTPEPLPSSMTAPPAKRLGFLWALVVLLASAGAAFFAYRSGWIHR